MKKVVVKLDLHDDKAKQKAIKSVSTFPGIDSIGMDMNERKLTVIGDVDPIIIVTKLRKSWHAEILSVRPAKEQEKKKEEPKKAEAEKKKEEPKKEDDSKKKEQHNQKDGLKKKEQNGHNLTNVANGHRAYNFPQQMNMHYYVQSAEEDPNPCVIS